MKKIKFMDVSFRDGFQSCLGARVKMDDFLPVLAKAKDAGIDNFEIGGGARFQSLYFYCQEDAFEMMSKAREIVGPNVNLQTLARGVNVVGLSSQSSDIIELHAKLFAKHGISTIRNFDALNDPENLNWSGKCIAKAGINHQVVVSLMSLPPGLNEDYAHTSQFYIDTLKKIMDKGIPYKSVCFKDASGTATPQTVYDTIKAARKLLGKDTPIQFHTHFTAGVAVRCHMAAIEAGADIIDLAMSPVSGGTSHVDIVTMWHALRGTKYTLDIDINKILEVEEFFKSQMEKYYMGVEAREVSPLIPFSPMPGGALTANTAMMRDNNCLDLFPKVIKEMRDVVAKGGFGTSVTPVSQFYFQQAFANVTQGPWKTITEGYGKMVLGYFGKTPSTPDKATIQLAKEQLKLEPTTKTVLQINDQKEDLGIKYNTQILKDNNIKITDENIFIVAACGDKGLNYLKGDKPFGCEMKDAHEQKELEKLLKKYPEKAPAKAPTKAGGPASYNIVVNGAAYHVDVAPAIAGVAPQVTNVATAAPVAASAPASGESVKAPMPGTVQSVEVHVGDSVVDGDVIVVIEAMKMPVEIKAHVAGTIQSIEVNVGDSVDSGQVVAII